MRSRSRSRPRHEVKVDAGMAGGEEDAGSSNRSELGSFIYHLLGPARPLLLRQPAGLGLSWSWSCSSNHKQEPQPFSARPGRPRIPSAERLSMSSVTINSFATSLVTGHRTSILYKNNQISDPKGPPFLCSIPLEVERSKNVAFPAVQLITSPTILHMNIASRRQHA